MSKNKTCEFGASLQGFYKLSVIDPTTNEVKWESDWNKNLILNQGMNNIAIGRICDSTLYGVAGTGSRPNSISGALSTITQSGATIRLLPLSGGLLAFTSSYSTYTTSVNVGDVIQDSDFSESMVTAVNANGINLTVTPSYTYSNEKTFVIWKTSQVGLEAEITRSSTYVPGIGNCGTTSGSFTPHILEHKRTYDFAPEVANRAYTEVGTAWASSGNTTVFSRMALPTTVVVSASYQLRVVYNLQATMSPYSASYFTASISGWPHLLGSASATIATQSIQCLMYSLVSTTGATSSTNGNETLEPYAIGGGNPYKFIIFASSDSQSLAPYGQAVVRSSNVVYANNTTLATYVTNSFYVDKSTVFTESDINIGNIRSIGVGAWNIGFPDTPPNGTSWQAFCVVFNEPQMKLNTQTLTITFRQSWRRTLA